MDAVVFTAHSLPRRVIDEGDPYAEQVAATAAGVAARAGVARVRAGLAERGPHAGALAGPVAGGGAGRAGRRPGARRVLVAPIGFVCDHTEILYDIDVQAQDAARARGHRRCAARSR